MIELRVLGAVSLRRDGRELHTLLAQPKRLAFLAYLCLAGPGSFHRRDRLVGLFWPESDQEHARTSLRNALHSLRRALGDAAIVTRGDEDVGVEPSVLWCDALRFAAAAEADDVDAAMALYRGDLLPGFFLDGAPEFERWLERERVRLREIAVRVAARASERREVEGDLSAAVTMARRAVELSGDDERAVRGLMALLDRLGDRAGALRAFEDLARRLAAEYQSGPSTQTTALMAEIRARQGSPTLMPSELRRSFPPEARVGMATGEAVTSPHSADRPLSTDVGASGSVSSQDTSGSRAQPANRPSTVRSRRTMVLAGLGASCLLIAGVWGASLRGDGASRRPETPTALAVLPLRNEGSERDEYLADGLTQELTGALARVRGFALRPYASVAAQRDGGDALTRARQLGVDYALTGGVRRSGDRIRVTLELIRAADGFVVWSPRPFESAGTDVFALQESIARQLVRQVPGRLADEGRATAMSRTARDPVAYDRYLQGRHFLGRVSLAGAQRALTLFEDAVRRDSSFADAWVGVSDAYSYLVQLSGRAPTQMVTAWRGAAERAIALDSTNGDALAARALLRTYYEWDHEGAARDYHRAVVQSPGSAWLHLKYSQFLNIIGLHDSALAEIERARTLDPTNAFFVTNLAARLVLLGRDGEAEYAARQALAMDSTQWVAHLMMAIIVDRRGDRGAAAREVERARALVGDVPMVLAQLAYRYGRAGRVQEASTVLAKLTDVQRREYVEGVWLAKARLGLGDRTGVLDALEASARAGDADLCWNMAYGFFEDLRDEPRYESLLRQTRLAPYMRPRSRTTGG